MSIFSWLSGKPSASHTSPAGAPADADKAESNRDRHSGPPSTKPVGNEARSGGNKSHRHARREQLYTAVREAMIRAGVLSASYKFKVLSLDPRGDQFMVMMDLSPAFGEQAERLSEIELMIAQSAKSRYDIRVTAVYWRINERVSTVEQTSAAGAPVASQPAPLHSPEAELPKPASRRYEPIQADEVAAFKQALAAASAQGLPAAPAAARTGRSAARSYTLLTGFEDTEMPETSAALPALSATQYGDLH
jgi:hypothetical protein